MILPCSANAIELKNRIVRMIFIRFLRLSFIVRKRRQHGKLRVVLTGWVWRAGRVLPGAPLLAFEKWPAESRNRALCRQHRGPLLKKREKWRTPSWLVPTIKNNPRLG